MFAQVLMGTMHCTENKRLQGNEPANFFDMCNLTFLRCRFPPNHKFRALEHFSAQNYELEFTTQHYIAFVTIELSLWEEIYKSQQNFVIYHRNYPASIEIYTVIQINVQ